MTIGEIWNSIYNFVQKLWGAPLVILLVGFGLYITIRTGFFQFINIKTWFKKTVGEAFSKSDGKKKDGQLSPLSTISTVLAGTVGSGNIAGVATAIAVGGPGAVFWMIVISLFSTMTKMCEVSLAVKFREKDKNGDFYGGPMYYMKKGIKGKLGKVLAIIFSITLIIQLICASCFVQSNTFAVTANYTFKVPVVLSGIVMIITTYFIVRANKIEKIGEICGKLVPIMVVIYTFACLAIIITNLSEFPNAIKMIFTYAFSPAPAIGGFAGAAVKSALPAGASRGVHSNEAGEGTATIVHAAAVTDHPIHQGMWGIFEVFMDTVVICSLTALAILTSGAWTTSGDATGVVLTLKAFESVVPTPLVWAIAVAILFFTYTTFVGNFIKFRTDIEFLFGSKAIKYLKFIYLLTPIVAVLLEVKLIWQIADIGVGLLIVPNMLALIILSPTFLKLFKEYKKKLAKEKSKE